MLGVGFLEVPELTSVQIVRFWDRNLASELPSDGQSPPYEVPIERFPAEPVRREVSLTLRNEPLPPRLLFFDDNHLVQLQQDWYAYNWRKTPARPDYERYEEGRNRFKRYLYMLCDYLTNELSVEFHPKQGEITYVNRIPMSVLREDPGPLGLLLNDIQPAAGNYLPEPYYAEASWGYEFKDDKVRGRLHITTNREVDQGSGLPLVNLTLTARGIPVSNDVDSILRFLDLGREWIVRGFHDITTPLMHKRWGYRQEIGQK